jgi:predicted nucleic acid-binding protein
MSSIAVPIHTSPAPPIEPPEASAPNTDELSADRAPLTLRQWEWHRVRDILWRSHRHEDMARRILSRIVIVYDSNTPITLYPIPEERRVIAAALVVDKDPLGTLLAEQDRAEEACLTAKALEKAFCRALDTSRMLAAALAEVRVLAGTAEVRPDDAVALATAIRRRVNAALGGRAR